MTEPSYQQALDYLYSLLDFETRVEQRSGLHYDLRRVNDLLCRFGNPQIGIPCVHIAGTKGKGSTAAMIASVLTRAGFNTGLYTSPHLVELTERISIDGTSISPDELVYLVNELRPVIAGINEKAVYGRLTTFEALTVLGFLYFDRKEAQFNVIETGLGGRLDATNVVQPEVAVITPVGLDHTDVLGGSLGLIAAEKAGIIKKGSYVVCAPQPPEAAGVIIQRCHQVGARVMDVAKELDVKYSGLEHDSQVLEIKSSYGVYNFKLPLLGSYQGINAASAIASLEGLKDRGFNITHQHIIEGLERVKWPGRFQVLGEKPLVIVDGAHNPESVAVLLESLNLFLKARQYDHAGAKTLIFGASSDKDVEGMTTVLGDYFDRIIVSQSTHPRAMATDALASEFKRIGKPVIIRNSVTQALKEALSHTPESGLILVSGSLFIAGDALRYFARETGA